MGQWVLVDTMMAEPSAVLMDGVPPESFRRALRVLSQVDRRAAPLLLGLVQRCVDEQQPLTWSGDGGSRPVHLEARPAVIHGGEVWAVWAWMGQTPPGVEPYRCGAIVWDQVARLAHPAAAALDLLGSRYEERASTRGTLTVTQLFSETGEITDFDSLLALLLYPAAGQRWMGWLYPQGSPAPLRLVMSGRSETEVAGYFHEAGTGAGISATVNVSDATLRALRSTAAIPSLALLDVEKARLIRWITDPPVGIQWKGLVDDRDTPHPDDVARIFAAAVELIESGKPVDLRDVRLRRREGGWMVIAGRGSLLRTTMGVELALVEMVETGIDLDTPDDIAHHDRGSTDIDPLGR